MWPVRKFNISIMACQFFSNTTRTTNPIIHRYGQAYVINQQVPSPLLISLIYQYNFEYDIVTESLGYIMRGCIGFIELNMP